MLEEHLFPACARVRAGLSLGLARVESSLSLQGLFFAYGASWPLHRRNGYNRYMGARKSLFAKNFKGESQASYISRTFGAKPETPLDTVNHMFFSSDWVALSGDHELQGAIDSIRHRESDLRELRLRLEALQSDSGAMCDRCGEPFYARANAKYCSSTCRVAAHRERRA